MKVSLLDRSRTRLHESDAEALRGSVARAVHAEQVGYDRFWVAEHHAVPGIASGAPAVLLAAVGARTSHLRIGSGGVMLPLHQPLVVAEQFLALEALYPGRVDLGLGRSLGFTPPVRRALRRDVDAAECFAEDLGELRGYLQGTAAVTARPATERGVPMHVLATGRGVELAARLGLPVVVGGPLLGSDQLGQALEQYRRDFQPYDGSAPYVTISLDVLVADDDASARRLALPEAWAMARSRQTGEFPPLEPVEDVEAAPRTAQVERRVEGWLTSAVTGGPATVRRRLDQLVASTGADEVGDRALETVVLRDLGSDERHAVDTTALFVLIGSVPHTAWLEGQVPLDERGFVLTGASTGSGMFETGCPGIFAVGDVRSGSVKRVASAVGEGAIVVRLLHEHLGNGVRR